MRRGGPLFPLVDRFKKAGAPEGIRKYLRGQLAVSEFRHAQSPYLIGIGEFLSRAPYDRDSKGTEGAACPADLWKLATPNMYTVLFSDFPMLGDATSAFNRCPLYPPKADIVQDGRDVRFSNRPVGVKRFQALHDGGVGVAHGLVLLYGIDT
jgi:hypothetical protein